MASPPLLADTPPAGHRTPAPKGLAALGLALRHLRAFWTGGIAAAEEAEAPTVVEPSLADYFGMTVAEYHQRYFDGDFMRGIFWMGVPALKMVGDLWLYQEILFRTRPDIVVEIGSHFGGSTLFIAHVLDQLGHGEVVSVDISRAVFMARHPRIREITGSSVDVVPQVRAVTGGLKTMVIHDADHSAAAVKRDLDLYGDLVSVGQYLIVEDGIVDVFNPRRLRLREMEEGPLPAVRAFVQERVDQFEIEDLHRRFALSASPFGYLRRVS